MVNCSNTDAHADSQSLMKNIKEYSFLYIRKTTEKHNHLFNLNSIFYQNISLVIYK